MGEGLGFAGRITDVMDGAYRDVAQKVWSMTRGRAITYAPSEVDTIVTNLKNATNAWLNLGATTLSAGPSGFPSAWTDAVKDMSDSWVRPLAEAIWARVSTDQSDRSEIDDLVISLKAAINKWMGVSPDTADQSEEQPYAPNRIGSPT